jgi:hypothetical protein
LLKGFEGLSKFKMNLQVSQISEIAEKEIIKKTNEEECENTSRKVHSDMGNTNSTNNTLRDGARKREKEVSEKEEFEKLK